MNLHSSMAVRDIDNNSAPHSLARPLWSVALTAAVWLGTSGIAVAVPIDPDLNVTASIDFVFGNPAAGGATQSGEFTLTQGGADTTSTIASDTTVTGGNPLSGALTDTGDGVGAILDQSGAGDSAENALGLDYAFGIANNSLTDTFEVTVVIDFFNSVDADGSDAFAESAFTFDENSTELFFTDLVSDTLFGDTIGGIDTGTFGDPLAEMGTQSLVFSLLPGATLNLSGTFDLEGGSFESDSSYTGLLDVFVSIGDVENITDPAPEVPVPGTLLLGALGLAGLGLSQRRLASSKRNA